MPEIGEGASCLGWRCRVRIYLLTHASVLDGIDTVSQYRYSAELNLGRDCGIHSAEAKSNY